MSRPTPQSSHSINDIPLGTRIISESLPTRVQKKQALYDNLKLVLTAITVGLLVSLMFIVVHNQDPSRGQHIQDCVDPNGQCRYEQRLQQVDLLSRQIYCQEHYPHGTPSQLKACLLVVVPSPPPPSPTTQKGAMSA